tara:strand:- start:105 stop:527 length:423 start_codon:yes stop_codon:yes gene_type:complete
MSDSTVQYPDSTREMAEFLSGNLDYLKEWGDEKVLGWLQWFVNNGRYYAVSKDGKLVGLTLLRFVDTEEQCYEHYTDTGGPICYIEASVSRYPKSLNAMYCMMWDELGHKTKWMAWVRHKYNDRVTKIDMNRAKRRFMRR